MLNITIYFLALYIAENIKNKTHIVQVHFSGAHGFDLMVANEGNHLQFFLSYIGLYSC